MLSRLPPRPVQALAPASLVVMLVACGSPDATPGGSFRWDAPQTPLDSAFVDARASYQQDANYADAFNQFEDLGDRAGTIGDSAQVARALTWMGLAAWRMDRYEDALDLGHQALDIKQRLGFEAQLFRSFNGLGLLAWNEGRLDDATGFFEDALAVEVLENPLDRFGAENNLGLVFTDLSRFNDATTHFERARSGYSAANDWREGRVLTNLAALQSNSGDAAAAITSLSRALALYTEHEDPIGYQNAIGQLGSAHLARGDHRRARLYLDSATVLARELNQDREVASNLSLLSEVHRATGDVREALSSLEAASQVHRRLGLEFESASDARSVAGLHLRLGNPTTALELARDALKTHRRLGARLEELYDLLTIVEILGATSGRGTPRELEEALELTHELGIPSARHAAALSLAGWRLAAGQPSHALTAIDSFDVSGASRFVRSELLRIRAAALLQLGRLDEAQTAIERAIDLRATVRQRIGPQRTVAPLEGLSDYHALRFAIALRSGDIEQAFLVADDARAPRWSIDPPEIDRDDKASVVPTSFESLAEAERQLRLANHLEWIADSLAASPLDWRGADFEAERASASDGARRAAAASEEARGQAQRMDPKAGDLLGLSELSIDSLRMVLEPTEVLVGYYVERDAVHAFAVTQEGVTHRVTDIGREDLRSRIRAVREQTSRPGRENAARSVLAGLYEQLIRPIESTLSGRTQVTIAPHAELSYVPWPALLDGRSGRYAIESWVLQLTPSVRSFMTLRRDRGTVTEPRRVVFAPSTEQLPHSRDEAAAIARVWRDTEVLLDEQATEQAFRDRLTKNFVLHAAAHGSLDPRSPLYSNVRFAGEPSAEGSPAQDGAIDINELLMLRTVSPLVFLSACETGVGLGANDPFQWGDDVTSLAQAFLFSGAKSVVSTLWRIEDNAAAELAARFYDQWEVNRTAAALASAQRLMIGVPELSAPVFWAGHQSWSADRPSVEARAVGRFGVGR